jgi:methylenetetrahydrofolate--tRNA-(uracil-5-)-methyltransferase
MSLVGNILVELAYGDSMAELIVIGGGLAGSEAAWQAAQRGVKVALYEMRPFVSTGAHTGSYLAELVCSNSLGSFISDRAPGLLNRELHKLDSLLLNCAKETVVPAGGALAVDREAFAQRVTERIENHPLIQVIREEITEISDQPTIVASGPLTSPGLSKAIAQLTGMESMFFYDAIAPIITLESINLEIAFRASRYERGETEEGDYINCPMAQQEYETFVETLQSAGRIELREFEVEVESGVKAGMSHFFEGCLPVEILARRGLNALSFGPMRPVGLINPVTGRRPYALVQLRQDNLAGSLYNLVGFQTNLEFSEQKRVFRMIPGLEHAEFVRFGQMHRNTYIFSPGLLDPTLQFRGRKNLFFAGQITGVEGYMGNIATGLLAGWNAARMIHKKPLLTFPQTTMIGALCYYVTHASAKDFQPMKANFGILPPLDLDNVRGKRQRGSYYAQRAMSNLEEFLNTYAGGL